MINHGSQQGTLRPATSHLGRSSPRWGVVTALAVLLLASCGGGSEAADVSPTTTSTTSDTNINSGPAVDDANDSDGAVEPDDRALVSFARDVQPVVVKTCARCHTGSGPGTPHLLLETADDVSDFAFAIATNVEIGAMPPWPATELSVPFQGDWSLTDAEIAGIKAWQAAGAPLDVDPATPIVPSGGVFTLTDFDIEAAPLSGGYSGVAGQPDEYRCLIFDPALEQPRYLEAFEFVPDQTEVVHHAIGYRIPERLRASAELRDGEDGQPGWSCFGSSGLGEYGIFLGWAPGQGPTELPQGAGMQMDAGDFLVIQIHYHFEVDAPPDLSSIHLRWSGATNPDPIVVTQYLAPAEIPCRAEETGPLCDRDAALARAVAAYGSEGVQANRVTRACGYEVSDFADMTTGVATGSCDQPIGTSGQVVSVLGHEHELGKTFRMTLNPGTPDERVLLDIDAWDFDWQYNYYPVEEIMVEAGDFVRLECSWDRALRDPDLEPAYVLWADGTNDEMCFATMFVRHLTG